MKRVMFLKAILFAMLVNYMASAQEVLKEGMCESGGQSFVWDSGDMPQGAYVLQLTAGGKTATEKILIAR